MNKYERKPDHILDLHGHTTREAETVMDKLIQSRKHTHVRVITGHGALRETGPVLKTFIRDYLAAHNIRYNQSKLSDGGEGAFEIFLKK